MYIKLLYYFKNSILNYLDNRVLKVFNIYTDLEVENQHLVRVNHLSYIRICKHNNRHNTGYSTWFYVFLNNDETSSQKLSLRLWFVGKVQVTKWQYRSWMVGHRQKYKFTILTFLYQTASQGRKNARHRTEKMAVMMTTQANHNRNKLFSLAFSLWQNGLDDVFQINLHH